MAYSGVVVHHHTTIISTACSVNLGIIAQSERDHIRFDDTYSMLMSGKLSKGEFEEIMASINAHPDIKRWLKWVHESNSCGIGCLIGVLTLGFSIVIEVFICDPIKQKKKDRAVSEILCEANCRSSQVSWSYVAPTSFNTTHFIKVDLA